MTDAFFTVFFGNLPDWVTSCDIEGWLKAEGLPFICARIVHDSAGASKRCAFVYCRQADEMEHIIHRFNGAPLDDRILRVSQAMARRTRAGER